MAPSFDCAVSSLFCAEDDNSIFYDDNNVDLDGFESTRVHRNHRINDKNTGFDGGLGLPVQSEECVGLMVEKERHHLPNGDYLKRLRRGELDLGARKEAIDWMGKVHVHYGFGPLCAYLSINYLDRFLSAYELPGKAWMMQLLAVACLSIAAKMEETEVPLSLDLQVGEARFVFEARTIQRMELLVLSTLSWRMQAITPFSFIDHFLHMINHNNEPPTRSLILQSIQLIVATTKGIDFLEFRPSEIAAAVAIAVVGEIKTVDTDQAISVLAQLVEKEKVMKCKQLIEDSSLTGGCTRESIAATTSVPQSPIGVLDAAACLSYRSDESTTGSCANSSQNSPPDAKRRKLNRPWEV